MSAWMDRLQLDGEEGILCGFVIPAIRPAGCEWLVSETRVGFAGLNHMARHA
jgi:hypothetical protein